MTLLQPWDGAVVVVADVVVVVTGFVTWKAEDSEKKREFVSLKFD